MGGLNEKMMQTIIQASSRSLRMTLIYDTSSFQGAILVFISYFGQEVGKGSEATWPFLFQRLLPHMQRNRCCGPANYQLYSSYTFGDQGTDHWVHLKTQ